MSTPTPKTWDEAVDEILDDFSLNVVTRRGDYKGFRDSAKSALNNAVKEHVIGEDREIDTSIDRCISENMQNDWYNQIKAEQRKIVSGGKS